MNNTFTDNNKNKQTTVTYDQNTDIIHISCIYSEDNDSMCTLKRVFKADIKREHIMLPDMFSMNSIYEMMRESLISNTCTFTNIKNTDELLISFFIKSKYFETSFNVTLFCVYND